MRKFLANVPFMALTATATNPVRNDIIENLKLKSPKVVLSGFNRYSFIFFFFCLIKILGKICILKL